MALSMASYHKLYLLHAIGTLTCYVHGLSGQLDQMKRMDQLTGQYKTNPNTNTNIKYVLIHYVINAGSFFSLDLAS